MMWTLSPSDRLIAQPCPALHSRPRASWRPPRAPPTSPILPSRSASALSLCEQQCRALGYDPVCGAFLDRGLPATAAFPNDCVFKCQHGSDPTARVTARGVRQHPKCERQYAAVGYVAGMCLMQGCTEPPPPPRETCEERCHRTAPFAPLCATTPGPMASPFENDW